jgi:hypothetical protein
MATSDGPNDAMDSYDVTEAVSESMRGRDHLERTSPSRGVVRLVKRMTSRSGSANGSGRSSAA